MNCSRVTDEGLDALLGYLGGKLCVMVGHSGVGKSSILNAIRPELNLPVRDPQKRTGKGRHRTTKSTLYELDGGVRVIDTPGVREFGLWQISAAELRWYFQEFDDFARQCKFSDCSHTHEPNCAVKAAVEAGEIVQMRYESYCRLLGTLDDKQK